MQETIEEQCREARKAARKMAAATEEQKNSCLRLFKDHLVQQKEKILKANAEDVEAAQCSVKGGKMSEALVKRLVCSGRKWDSLIGGIDQVIKLDDPIDKVTLTRELSTGLLLRRISCPIGVLCVIFEARPEAAVQIASLAIKSGNALLLKGGSEAARSNRAIYSALAMALEEAAGIPPLAVQLLETRTEIATLLRIDKHVDLIIPRGSNELVTSIKSGTRIPVLGHADGICSVYVDESADLQMACKVVRDSKTDYSAACNAMETLLVHKAIAAKFLPAVANAMPDVKFHAESVALQFLPSERSGTASRMDFSREFLALECAVKVVDSVEEAVEHINSHGSGHTDSIIAIKDSHAAEYFLRNVDSAGVYLNCSTRFADGYRYGFGAEVGISTNRIHCRGPVGLDGLVIYKYQLTGTGQTVSAFASGEAQWTHKDIPC